MKYLLYGIIALILLIAGAFFYLGQSSQSGTAPGLVEGSLTPCPDSPNCVTSEAHATDEQRVDPLPLESWDALPDAIGEMGGTVVTQEGDYIAAEFTESIFGFVDDVEFRLADDAVQLRSASRVGYSDMGVNGDRVTEIRQNLGG